MRRRHAIAELNARLGFDRPLIVQYLEWMGRALTGDLGRSYSTHQTVADAILPRLPVTLELGVLAIALATFTAVVVNSITTGRRVVRPVATALRRRGDHAAELRAGPEPDLHVLGQARLAAVDRLGAVVGRARDPRQAYPAAGPDAVGLLLRLLHADLSRRVRCGPPASVRARRQGKGLEREQGLVPPCACRTRSCRSSPMWA